MKEILVMGIGNLLLSDEGLGIHVVEYLKGKPMPENIDLLDGGTGGFHLLSLMNEYQKMIIVDAALDEEPPGTVKIVRPKYSNDFPRALTTHDIGLKDLIDTASVLNILPEIVLVVVTISPHQDIGMQLSLEIETTLPVIYEKIIECANVMNVQCSRVTF